MDPQQIERYTMNRLILTGVAAAILAGCSSTPSDRYDRRAHEERQRQSAEVESALSNAPKWMSELPRSNSAVYASGTSVSRDMAMSENKAKTIAFGKICVAAGGRVDQQSSVFQSDRDDVSVEISEMAIRSFCPAVDISGAEVVETKMVAEGNRFRSYVLVALPTGAANTIQRSNEQRSARRQAEQRNQSIQREMDANRSQVSP
jgi:hypothetical protein